MARAKQGIPRPQKNRTHNVDQMGHWAIPSTRKIGEMTTPMATSMDSMIIRSSVGF